MNQPVTSIDWVAEKVRFIDQTLLPLQELYIDTRDYRVVGEAIRVLKIRGAPAIGVAAAYGMLLAVNDEAIQSEADCVAAFETAVAFLGATRPTAVNLFTALRRIRSAFEGAHARGIQAIRDAVRAEAVRIHREDIEACSRIGEFGAELISAGSTILTHCNTGALATAGEGTAQAVITAAVRQGKVNRVYADETRPLFQGARLTSWELMRLGVDVTLITDNTAGYVMQQKRIDAVIVGADRIAANGDTANKIGTYSVAVLAAHHGVPFYVAAPVSTLDFAARTGADIPVEERHADEVTHVAGHRVAAEGVKVYAPAFDVTPHTLIAAIVTDKGVLRPPYGDAIAALKKSLSVSNR
jgi:methylthioribose-1-phosphate isomerase